jgi:hypothetical protein
MAAEDRTPGCTPLARGCRRNRVLAVVMFAAGAVGGSACAQEADLADVAVGDVEYKATPEFVAAAAERSQAQPYRMELRESLAGSDEVVVETGEWDGRRFYLRSDLSAPLGELLPDDVDLSIETAGDSSTLYVRLPEVLRAGVLIVPFGDLADDLGGGWGRVDLDELADLPPEQHATTSAIGMHDPRLFVDVVTKSNDVEELGEAEIRGVPVRGLAAEVPYAELLAAQGTAGRTEMNDITVPVEVWVDREGLVRRVGFGFRTDDIADAFGSDGTVVTGPSFAVDVDVTIDLFDHGDESISVELPADAIDVTGAFRELLESMAGALVPPGAT